jgi:alpha-glucan,water dikinase
VGNASITPRCHLHVAALSVLQANGDNNAYWRVLSDAGITRQRLESFDRPVKCEPEWFGSGKKDVLIREFRNYLGILKAVHSGANGLKQNPHLAKGMVLLARWA